MMNKIVWKEWRENRWKYATLWFTFNAPVVILALALGLSRGARTPFADLSDGTIMKYLPMALVEPFLVASIFLLVTGFVGVATFLPEIDEKALFFHFEQPISRKRYAAAKVLNGACQVGLAVSAAILLAPAVAYGMMLLSGKITLAGSAATFGAILNAAARSTVWVSLLSVAVFAGSALIAALVPRWWLAIPCAILFVIVFGYFALGDNRFFAGGSFFEIFPTIEGRTASVSANIGTGSAPWLAVTDPFPMPTTFAPWRVLPMVTTGILIALFSAGIAVVYERKELK